jgi:hypothetical protein
MQATLLLGNGGEELDATTDLIGEEAQRDVKDEERGEKAESVFGGESSEIEVMESEATCSC